MFGADWWMAVAAWATLVVWIAARIGAHGAKIDDMQKQLDRVENMLAEIVQAEYRHLSD